MMSSNGNIFRVTGNLCGVFIRSLVNSMHKSKWRRALMFSLICVSINGWVNNREAGDLRHYHAHYYVIVMVAYILTASVFWRILSWKKLVHGYERRFMSMIIIFYDRNVHAEEDLFCQYRKYKIGVGCLKEFLPQQEKKILVYKGIFPPTRQGLYMKLSPWSLNYHVEEVLYLYQISLYWIESLVTAAVSRMVFH